MDLNRDIKSPAALVSKGWLFLLLGLVATACLDPGGIPVLVGVKPSYGRAQTPLDPGGISAPVAGG